MAEGRFDLRQWPSQRIIVVTLLFSFVWIVKGDSPTADGPLVVEDSLRTEMNTDKCVSTKAKTLCAKPTDTQSDSSAVSEDNFMTAEDRLRRDLFRTYQKSSIAATEAGRAVQVVVGFTLIQLNNLDEKGQVLTVSGWLDLSWSDSRFGWDEASYGNMSNLVVNADQVWLPDMALQNSAKDIYHSSMVDDKFRVIMYPDGNMFWVPGGKYFTNCKIDISYFPFDNQVCQLHFTNWAYDGKQMNLSTLSNEINLDNYQVNGEWDLYGTMAYREDKYYACCGDTPYPSIYYVVYLRRKYLFYITNILAPCLMLSFLVTLVFFLPPDAGEKVSLGVTLLLSFTVFLLLIAESIPKNSDTVPVISIYLAIFLAITTMSIFTTVLVLHIHHMGADTQVPDWLKTICFHYLACLFFMTTIREKYLYTRRQQRSSARRDAVTQSAIESQLRRGVLVVNGSQRSQVYPAATHHSVTAAAAAASDAACRVRKSVSTTDEKLAQFLMPVAARNTTLEQILDHLKAVTKDRLDRQSDEKTHDEWKDVARVIDRCLFFVSFCLIGLSSILILVAMPLSKVEAIPGQHKVGDPTS